MSIRQTIRHHSSRRRDHNISRSAHAQVTVAALLMTVISLALLVCAAAIQYA